MTRTVIFGGSFNPLHNGHLRIAVEALESYAFDEVWLLPSGTPPHRQRYAVSGDVRLHMVELACLTHPQLRACDYEIRRGEPSYSVDTVRALRALHPDRSFSFLTGIDAVMDYAWKDFGVLLGQLELFLTASRPGYRFEALAEKYRDYPHADRLRHLPVPLHEVSSSLIRERLAQGRSIAYWVPDNVLRYIEERQLYRGSTPQSV